MAMPTTLSANAYAPARVRDELSFTTPIAAGGGVRKSSRRVQEWLTLQGFGLVIDGDFGPATEAQVRAFQARKGLPVTGVCDGPTWDALVDPLVRAVAPLPAGPALGQLTAAYARQHIAQHPREVGGQNRGPWVRAYMGDDGPEWLWCAGFVCFALEHAATTLAMAQPIKSSASCDTLAERAKAAHLFHVGGTPGAARPADGSFVLVRRSVGDWSHVGIVENADPQNFDTLEGNSNDDGSSNGFEALARKRNYAGKDFIIW